jgi:hypothetical protein
MKLSKQIYDSANKETTVKDILLRIGDCFEETKSRYTDYNLDDKYNKDACGYANIECDVDRCIVSGCN